MRFNKRLPVVFAVAACISTLALAVTTGTHVPRSTAVDWQLLNVGQVVEFQLPGGWWHEGQFEEGELPLMKSGATSYLAYVAKVNPSEGIWLAGHREEGDPVVYGHVMTVSAELAESVSFEIHVPETP